MNRCFAENCINIKSPLTNAVCGQLGISPNQAIRHLGKVGVPYRRRPRVLTHETEKTLNQLLRSGEEREIIAETLGIRKSFIKDYLARHSELRKAWESAHDMRQRGCYREKFLRVLHENPGVPIKRIRRIPGNGFDWLYRNDRDWLASNLPGIWRRPSMIPF